MGEIFKVRLYKPDPTQWFSLDSCNTKWTLMRISMCVGSFVDTSFSCTFLFKTDKEMSGWAIKCQEVLVLSAVSTHNSSKCWAYPLLVL